MKDMFDDFMKELRRRQAEREGADKKTDGGSEDAETGPTDEGSAEDATMRSDGPGSDESDQDEEERPTPVFGRGGFGGGPGRPRRYSGGPSARSSCTYTMTAIAVPACVKNCSNRSTRLAAMATSLAMARVASGTPSSMAIGLWPTAVATAAIVVWTMSWWFCSKPDVTRTSRFLRRPRSHNRTS